LDIVVCVSWDEKRSQGVAAWATQPAMASRAPFP